MENSAKSLFYSILFNKFHHRTKQMAFFFSKFVFERKLRAQNPKQFGVLRVPPFQISTQDGKMKIIIEQICRHFC
jgi:hypothetical protein